MDAINREKAKFGITAAGRKTILGISPGTKAIGIVILNDDRLDLWSIHVSGAAALTAAESLVDRYNVTDIAILKGHTRTGYPNQNRLIADIRGLAQAARIPVRLYSTYDLRKLSPDSPRNKKTMFCVLTGIFPELSAHYYKYQRERNAYWSKLFEAAACAYFIAGQ